MEKKDYYQILGIKPDANMQQLKEAYRKLALLYHPDRNPGDSEAVSRMKDLNEAYAVISDPMKRQEYDALRDLYGASAYGRFRQGRTEKDIFKDSDVREVFEEICRNFGFRGAQEVFKEFYGPGVSGPFNAGLRFERSHRHVWSRPFNILRGIRAQKGRDFHDFIFISPWLALKGGKVRYRHKERERTLLVTIPPGVRHGQKMRLRGMGGPGRGGGDPGDLFLTLRVGQHPAETLKRWMRLGKEIFRGIREYLSRLSKR